jgi:hypothetical protein
MYRKLRAVRMISFFGLLFLICSSLGCSYRTEEALSAVTKDRDATKQALAKADVQIAQLQMENQQLKQTAHFYFDQAVSEMSAADNANTNAADHLVISKFQEVVNRFPGDPLAGAAAGRIKNLEQQIFNRDLVLGEAQAEVVRLVKICHDSSEAIVRINKRDDLLMADQFNHIAINASALLAEQKEKEPYEDVVQKAKKKAQSLLQNVPDPDGTLGQEVDACDSTDA